MSRLLTLTILAAVASQAPAADKGTVVELAGMKSATPADWKEEPPSNTMRMMQFRLPKAEGDAEEAELALFMFPGGSGSVEANLKRQVDKFLPEGRQDKSDKIAVGGLQATYQDVTGTFIKKPFPMARDGTRMEGYRQLYVLFEGKDGRQYYMTLLGPEKTVEKHKNGFEEWLKNFK